MSEPSRHLLGVTTAHLPVLNRMPVVPAELVGNEVRPGTDRGRTLELDGQEFLLFRGARSRGEVQRLAGLYGTLGLHQASLDVDRDPSRSRSWPLWYRLLSRDPKPWEYADGEPAEDWARQCGLLDFAVGLLGLRRHPQARRQLARRGEVHWSIASIRDGAEGTRWRLQVHPGDPGGPAQLWLFPPSEPRRPQWQETRAATLRIELTSRGLDAALRDLANPWLERVRPTLMEHGGKTTPGASVPRDLLGVLWVQFTNAYLTGIRPKLCAWERCPGPPERPQVFLWRWGRGIKHPAAAIYCHPRCKQAKAQASHRRSPATERGKK